ncbi:MAG TPA: DsrE/DsrF/DrsH-like family protein [Nitrososphaerales archaeon]|nr:DsrE/DsrF/DrsH-like family protein [Nitrososphaerales archaeon]
MATVTVQKERTPEREVAQNKVCIVLSKGSLDMVYPAFMIGNTAATMGSEVHIFFTFWGLSVLNKKKVGSLKISPVGNPGMPMPNILGMIPGMTRVATWMLKGKMKKIKMPSIPEMIATSKDLGVHLHACSTTMSMDIIGFPKEELIPEAEDIIGAATFLQLSQGATTLFI